MSPTKIVLLLAAALASGPSTAHDGTPASQPPPPAGTASAGAANTSQPRFPACVQPAARALAVNEIAPGCYTVCTSGAGAHTAAGGVQKGKHLQVGDGVEIGEVKQLTLINIRPNNTGGPDRPDEQWPMLGSDKTKIVGARAFKHTNPDTTTVAVPHTITISKVPDRDRPESCRKNNVIQIKFCNDMVVTNVGVSSTRFLCTDPSPTIAGTDQGHVHAEN